MTRVLIGTPTFEYHAECVEEFAGAIRQQTEQRFDLILVDNSRGLEHAQRLRSMGLPVFRSPHHAGMRERMTAARNLIREVLLRGEYSHLLFLDQDVILPPFGLERLLDDHMPAVSGVYCKSLANVSYAMVVLPDRPPDPFGVTVTPVDQIRDGHLIEIDAAGFGCFLVEQRLCRSIAFRHAEDDARDADMLFSEDLRANGVPIVCDPRVRCSHRYVERNFAEHPEWGVW